ncbi:hypothetical protein [Streptosporangium carneum]|uniref:DUF4871 domain-containing protein n=1 Tax=Streptosporangium carneum TaxID=47481 RepID=A0A9W6MAV3_9ACTN|nr:hypothetical protein [Streptosporangium carneum]GLK07003.1 hypothetical protein GCM10017600_04080 [Streptosporangium carneum]
MRWLKTSALTLAVVAMSVAVSACGASEPVGDARSPAARSPEATPTSTAVAGMFGDVCQATRTSDRPAQPSDEMRRKLQAMGGDPAAWYGEKGLWVVLETSRFAYAAKEGEEAHIKMPWWRERDEQLTFQATSLQTGETVVGDVPGGYAAPGFQASGVDLPHLGCWRVTGALGATRVSFVLDVVSAPKD